MPDTVLPAAPPDSAALVALLDRLRPGDWLAFASDDTPLAHGTPTLRVDAPLEHVAGAVLPLLPISRHTHDPLLRWTAAEADPDIADLTYAMQGLASDGSGRRMTAAAIDDTLLRGGVDAVDAAIRVPWHGVPFHFLVCVGGGAHRPTDLTAPQPALAEAG
ncbi:hypothetical protein [Leifsonia virtsii]|uniref:Isochorismate synthase n=1 Tax=Leifsonia virtsii TaxID=3035915 RepID=A0ABT8IVL1_9MICO|nr:hypothetical protein [Leifsonia virtsii]MDN4596858.1 hypothetical protein [Leifsonia virtsii]